MNEPARRGVMPSVAVAASLLRAGVVAGLWPVLVGEAGLQTLNLVPYLLHLGGSLATVAVLAGRHAVMRLVAIAFTGYSTVVLGLGAPAPLSAALWGTGVLAVVTLLLAALRGRELPQRWSWVFGVLAFVVATVAVSMGSGGS